MERSADRILTTHCGSLARPTNLLKMMMAKESGQAYDHKKFATTVRSAVADVVQRQVDAGVDVVCDGEQGKASFLTYAKERLSGFETVQGELIEDPWKSSKETISFPEFYVWWYSQSRGGIVADQGGLVCTGPISYTGQAALGADIDNLTAALEARAHRDAFMTAISPTDFASRHRNEYYSTEEEYLYAVADAMREEYEQIVNAGYVLQIDDPRLLTYYVSQPELTIENCREWAELRVDILNHALRNIPTERVRFHTCYGINMGPRVHDMPLKDVVDIILKVDAGAYSFEAANPRHEHEWLVWENAGVPEGKILIPGVISHTTYLVEHPELVAQRIVKYAKVVGEENVIAGTDCGFSSFANTQPEIHPSIVWAKFEAMAEGARLATSELCRHKVAPARRSA